MWINTTETRAVQQECHMSSGFIYYNESKVSSAFEMNLELFLKVLKTEAKRAHIKTCKSKHHKGKHGQSHHYLTSCLFHEIILHITLLLLLPQVISIILKINFILLLLLLQVIHSINTYLSLTILPLFIMIPKKETNNTY